MFATRKDGALRLTPLRKLGELDRAGDELTCGFPEQLERNLTHAARANF